MSHKIFSLKIFSFFYYNIFLRLFTLITLRWIWQILWTETFIIYKYEKWVVFDWFRLMKSLPFKKEKKKEKKIKWEAGKSGTMKLARFFATLLMDSGKIRSLTITCIDNLNIQLPHTVSLYHLVPPYCTFTNYKESNGHISSRIPKSIYKGKCSLYIIFIKNCIW